MSEDIWKARKCMRCGADFRGIRCYSMKPPYEIICEDCKNAESASEKIEALRHAWLEKAKLEAPPWRKRGRAKKKI